MVLVVCLDEVLEDRTRLPDVDLLAVREGAVGDGGHAAVWINREEPWLLLDSGGEVEFLDGVRDTELLEGNGDFDTVRCLSGVQGDRGSLGGSHCARQGFEVWRIDQVFGDVE